MKQKNLLFAVLTALTIIATLPAHAQFGDLLQKAKDKAAKKASDALDKKTSGNSTDAQSSTHKSSKLVINSEFDFIPGDSVIVADNFAGVATGSSTRAFKTNGSASVVTIKDEAGKWLALADNATYKLAKQLYYPKRFTVEFDVLAVADQVKDIYPVIFGFTKDNSVTDYNSGNGAYVSLMYYNDTQVDINSSYTDKYLNTSFELPNYANRPMHVSVAVDGDRMTVYLDKTKLADTQLFLPSSPKNFYISGPMRYQHDAKVLIGNFRVMTFKKG
jgi:hypothetical protein